MSQPVVETLNGWLIWNPHLTILNQAHYKYGKSAAKFEMLPADRASITETPPEDMPKARKKTGAKGKPDKAKVVGFFE